ncbi:response regulator [Scytonema sp. UIC 10036]|uniref:response regulator n=1 Tax=Scytonema sp. UIC 10036 TaxID=2304196 RepID=UPI0012DA9B29|nr:response regulator transcription factor [Scytonema sp. UIC 10036]MUG91952.1 response regulator [Scytonema sp. UIC 10036]
MNQSDVIRVLIADDHPIFGEALAKSLGDEPDITVVGHARNGREALELFRQYQPDVTLMDLRMPEVEGVSAITAIRAEFDQARIIVLTIYDTEEDIYRTLRAGAKGYLLKGAETDELLAAIRSVHSGQQYFVSTVIEKLAERTQRLSSQELSERELEVIRLMVTGKSNQQISTDLNITERTVKFHINKIFSKLNVNDRTQAVIVALKRGIASL